MDVDLENYLSKDADTEGFDLQAGKSWIYPTNYPMREYQFRIVQEALYQNTFVSLPTGLGKTFIAAVVMYNFYRWYPTGKIIFMAPTRPLVKQQIDACYDIMAIPQSVTAELTGTKVQTSREDIWKTKRVFFVTPQVLQNDVVSFPDLAGQIKCLVFDEAHRARGNHAYCEVIRKLLVHSKCFRVLALSATPGNSTNDIIDVFMNLLISHLEVRTEDSPDVVPYIFHRVIETVVVPLGGKLEEMRNKYLKVLEKYVKVLIDHKIIRGNCANLTKGKIFMTLKDFSHRSQHHKHPNHGDIVRTLNVCITLYHGYELLMRHGMRGFLNFFEEHSEKALLRGNTELLAVMDEIQQYIGPRPEINLLPDGTIPQIPDNSKFGHPKFYKLQNIVLQYFSDEENKGSKVIIFSEFKETVMEIYAMLVQHTPVVRPKYFMGQGAITQKQQIKIVKSFKDGECNALISTCIGEEGLDIGEVDLIICFDISNKSPIRLIQRMGRTGRKKQGKVIILVTQGKEQELLKDSLANKNYLSNHILKSPDILKNLYKDNPRMIPENVFPSCQQMHISVPKVTEKSKGGTIKDIFNRLAKKEESLSQVLTDVEVIETADYLKSSVLLWSQSEPLSETLEDDPVKIFTKSLDTLRVHQPTEKIGHSIDTNILVSLLQFSDSKRYNLPVTQPTISSQVNRKRKITQSEGSDNFKQTDIRNMFTKPKNASTETSTGGSDNLSQINSQESAAKKKVDTLTSDLLSEISSFMIICDTETRTCNFCTHTSLCNRLRKSDFVDFNTSDWTQPDIATVENLTETDFDTFLQSITKKDRSEVLDDKDIDALKDMMDMDEESFNFEETPKKSRTFSFEVPKSIEKVVGNRELSFDAFEDESCDKKINQEKTVPTHKNEERKSQKQNIFSPKTFEDSLIKYNKTIQFFKLNDLKDLWEGQCKVQKCDKSPDIFDESPVISTKIFENHSSDSSPIICSYTNKMVGRKIQWDTKTSCDSPQKIGVDNPKQSTEASPQQANKSSLKSKLQRVTKSSFYVPKNKSDVEKQVDCKKINEEIDAGDLTKRLVTFNDICDLSIFGIPSENDSFKPEQDANVPQENEKNCSDCSEDLFASPPSNDNQSDADLNVAVSITEEKQKSIDLIPDKSPQINKDHFDTFANTSKNSNLNLGIADICDTSFFGLSQELIKSKSSSETIVSPESALTEKKTFVTTPKNKSPYDHYTVDLTIESPINANKTTSKGSSEKDSDGSLSPVLDYTKPIQTQKGSCAKSLFLKNANVTKSPQLSLEDLCDLSIFDVEMTVPDKTNKTGSLSPVLTQKFRRPNLLTTKKVPSQHSGKAIESKSQKQEILTPKLQDTSSVTITQVIDMINNPVKKENTIRSQKNENSLLHLLDDDNAFETLSVRKTPIKTATSKKPNSTQKTPKSSRKRITRKISFSNSDDEFAESPLKSRTLTSSRCRLPLSTISAARRDVKVDDTTSTLVRNRKKRKKKTKNPYIDDEAVMSSDEYATDDSDSEGGPSQDVFEESFVTNVDVSNTTTMHAKYLESVRSPLRKVGAFKIPDHANRSVTNVFSQKENFEDNTYLNDSFCVDVEESQITYINELSELEIAERQLEKCRKQKRNADNVVNYKKRRRIVVISSDSE